MTPRLHTAIARFKALFSRTSTEQAFDEELQTHVDLLTERYLHQGMPPREAQQAAQRQFGNATLLKQHHRELRSTMFFANIARDLRYATRQLARTPIFTIVCVVTLALGIGANTAVFSVMHAVLMKMLPVNQPGRLVMMQSQNRPDGASDSGNGSTSLSWAVYTALSARKDAFEDVMVYVPLSFSGKTAVRSMRPRKRRTATWSAETTSPASAWAWSTASVSPPAIRNNTAR